MKKYLRLTQMFYPISELLAAVSAYRFAHMDRGDRTKSDDAGGG
jgi:hypothetical protein